MKACLHTVDDHGTTYTALMFVCPGCIASAVAKGHDGYEGLHMLPVNAPGDIGRPSWEWDGNLEAPTLSPSILTDSAYGRCHSFLRNGAFEFLSDSTHPLAGQHVPMPDLPDWAANEA